jgi:hypothetical protein
LESLHLESRRFEGVGGIRDRGVVLDDPSGLGEPADELDPVEPLRKALSDEDGGTGADHAADLVCGDRQVRDVVEDEGEPGGVRRFVG